ncbi:MAG: hypothetical protein ACLFWD_12400 [Anaerolineales bacterium]
MAGEQREPSLKRSQLLRSRQRSSAIPLRFQAQRGALREMPKETSVVNAADPPLVGRALPSTRQVNLEARLAIEGGRET